GHRGSTASTGAVPVRSGQSSRARSRRPACPISTRTAFGRRWRCWAVKSASHPRSTRLGHRILVMRTCSQRLPVMATWLDTGRRRSSARLAQPNNVQNRGNVSATDFRPLGRLRMADLFDGCLKEVGVHEHQSKEATANSKCLTDGRNCLWVYGDEKGLVSVFSRYGMNAPQRILQAIADRFHVDIVSEYEPKFWGYETTEEWEAAWAAIAEEEKQNFYNQVVNFVRGEGHNITPGTIGMIKAEIAKRLIAVSPDLL